MTTTTHFSENGKFRVDTHTEDPGYYKSVISLVENPFIQATMKLEASGHWEVRTPERVEASGISEFEVAGKKLVDVFMRRVEEVGL